MSSFLDVLDVTPYGDGVTWYLNKPFSYDLGVEGSGNTIDVPAGFTTDFASVPKVFWNLLPPWGKYGPASVLHDWLYWNQTTTREVADGILREAMQVCKVSVVDINIIYDGVRIGGQHAWDNNATMKRNGYSKLVSEPPKSVLDLSAWKVFKNANMNAHGVIVAPVAEVKP
jgi:hypothetical protein